MVVKLIKKLRLKLKKKFFKIQVQHWKDVISKTNDLYSYPLVVSLSMEENWYWERYLRDIPLKDSLLYKLGLLKKRIKRAQKAPHSNDVYRRLERIRRKKEDREFFEKCEQMADEYDNKQ